MLGVKNVTDFSLSDFKKLRNFYVLTKCPLVYAKVNGYRFMTRKKLKFHEMDANKIICVQQNI